MKRILIIDSLDDLFPGLSISLMEKRYLSAYVQSKSEAVSVLPSFKPDVILIDAFLPDGSSKLACREIRSYYTSPSIPIILMSVNQAFVSRHTEFGADAGIHRPFTFDSLLRLLNYFVP